MDGRMYLAGISENLDSLNCVEAFNRKTQTWKPVPPEKQIPKLQSMEGKIFMNFSGMFCKKGLVINPKESTSEVVGFDMDFNPLLFCVVDKITYWYKSSGVFEWRDTVAEVWRKLEGLEGLPKFGTDSCTVKLVDYGGKMVVLWDEYVPASGHDHDKKIWCAEILLEKRNSEEIRGNVEWFHVVLTVPKSCKVMSAIAATV